MGQQPSWLAQSQPQHPSKLQLPQTTGRVILKITLYFFGAIIAEFSLLGVTGSNFPLACTTSSVSLVAFIGSVVLFFSKGYYIHCLPRQHYFWWMFGATGTFLVLFVTIFSVSDPNKNHIANAVAVGTLALYGVSFMWIAHFKPSVAQQVNESVYRMLKSAPGRQMIASDLLARLRKKYREGDAAFNQYLSNLEYLELTNIPGAPELVYRMKQQKPVALTAPMSLPPVDISYAQVAFKPVPPQISGKPMTAPQSSHSPTNLNTESIQRSLADRETIPVLPAAQPNQMSASSPSQKVVLPKSAPAVALTPPIQHPSFSSPKSTSGDARFIQPVAYPHSKPNDPVPQSPDSVISSTPSAPPGLQPSPFSAKKQRAIQIFCCYAHEDDRLLEKLKTHLKPQQRQGLIHIWHDRDIRAGAEWEKEIEQELNKAQVVLLLVSPDFVASDYCYNTEMQQVLERHARGEIHAIPIILRPTDWRITPLGKLPALPKDGKPITTWSNSDNAYLDVVTGIRTIVETHFTQQQQPPKQMQPQNNVESQKAETEVELIRTRCAQGKLIITNNKIAVELTTFGKVMKSQILLRSSLTSIDSKVAVFPILGIGGGMNLTFHGKGRETLKAELVPFKEAQAVLSLLS